MERDKSKKFFKGRPKEKPEFDQKILDIARVTRVMGGGRRFSFRIAAVIGNKKGKVGVGVAKGSDVAMAMEKAVNDAKKHMIDVSIQDGTIPHEMHIKYKNVKLLLNPAKEGRGVIAGGAVRTVCEFAGIQNISAKLISKSKNKINNARATVKALSELKGGNKVSKKPVAKEEDKGVKKVEKKEAVAKV